ncbi:MAG: IS5/IS1182 family transposase, partial [Candidatus Micrarchaeaceae archaeon]
MLAKYKFIPYFGDYTTLWKRIHKIKIKIIPENKEVVESDGTCLKTSNAGEYRQFKYGDINAKRKKYLVVIITADVKKRKLLNLEIQIQGEGQSEPKVAEKQIKEASKKYKIKKFYGDSAYNTNNMFEILQSVGAEAAIKI